MDTGKNPLWFCGNHLYGVCPKCGTAIEFDKGKPFAASGYCPICGCTYHLGVYNG